MNGFLDSLNLRPQERRLVVAIGVVLFVVLNFWLVWPHFGDWGRLTMQLARSRQDIERFNKEIALDENPVTGFRKELAKLQSQGGNKVLLSEQNQLQSTVQSQAVKAGVTVSQYQPIPALHAGASNEFFEEQSLRITTESDEAQLVNFLYQVGTDSSMIRVHDLDLKPADPNRYRLRGIITLTANYQKKTEAPAPAKAGAPAAKPGAKPAGPPVTLPKPPTPVADKGSPPGSKPRTSPFAQPPNGAKPNTPAKH